ncbi:MAG: MFS transporter [Chloroflexota bacterium]
MKSHPISRLIILASISFALTMATNTLEPSVFGHKILQLAPENPNTALGLITFISSLVIIVLPPIVGALSDRTQSRWGQRIPYFIIGSIFLVISLFLIATSRSVKMLLTSVVIFQIAFSVIVNPWQAQYPDLVSFKQRGTAAGIRGLADVLGLIIGRKFGGDFVSQFDIVGDVAIRNAVIIPVIAIILAVSLTIIYLRNLRGNSSSSDHEYSKIDWKKLYFVNLKSHPAFGWWFANRFLYWAAFTILSTFLLFFAIDVIGLPESNAQKYLGNLALFLGGGILIITIPAGWFADKYGRKPLVVISGIMAAIGSLLILFIRDLNLLSVAGLIIGAASGIFVTSNFALISDIVPSKEAGRYMGVAGIAGASGSAMARLIGGLVVDPINAYYASNSLGYLIMYALAAVLFLLSAMVATRIPIHKIDNSN